MIKNKDLVLITHLRKNSRISLTKVSRQTQIPVSTLFEKLKKFEGNIINKHTTIIDFNLLGYSIISKIFLKVKKDDKERVKNYLIKNQYINSLALITNDFDFLIEAIFKNLNELQIFTDDLEQFNIENKEEYFVIEDLKREEFIADPSMIF